MGKIRDYLFQQDVTQRLTEIADQLTEIVARQKVMATNMELLAEQVARTEDIEQSVVTILQAIQTELTELAQQLADANVDSTKVLELRDRLHTSEVNLAAAVATYSPPPPQP